MAMAGMNDSYVRDLGKSVQVGGAASAETLQSAWDSQCAQRAVSRGEGGAAIAER